jgi:hypothetical protein
MCHNAKEFINSMIILDTVQQDKLLNYNISETGSVSFNK